MKLQRWDSGRQGFCGGCLILTLVTVVVVFSALLLVVGW
jgi:hypothetical protein